MAKELPIKNEFASGLLELSRLATTECVTSSRRLSSKPCWVLSVSFAPTDAAALHLASLENSEITLVNTLIQCRSQYGQTKIQPPIPIYFNKGLFVTLEYNTQSVTVQYLQDSP